MSKYSAINQWKANKTNSSVHPFRLRFTKYSLIIQWSQNKHIAGNIHSTQKRKKEMVKHN